MMNAPAAQETCQRCGAWLPVRPDFAEFESDVCEGPDPKCPHRSPTDSEVWSPFAVDNFYCDECVLEEPVEQWRYGFSCLECGWPRERSDKRGPDAVFPSNLRELWPPGPRPPVAAWRLPQTLIIHVNHARQAGDDARAAWLLCERAVLAVNLLYANAGRLARRVDDDGRPGPLEVAPVLGGGGLSIEGGYGAWMHVYQGYPWLFDPPRSGTTACAAGSLACRTRRFQRRTCPGTCGRCGSSSRCRMTSRCLGVSVAARSRVRWTSATLGCEWAFSRRCAPVVNSIGRRHTIRGCVNRSTCPTTSRERGAVRLDRTRWRSECRRGQPVIDRCHSTMTERAERRLNASSLRRLSWLCSCF